MAYTLGNKCAINYCKRTIPVQFIVEDVVTCFFWNTVYNMWNIMLTAVSEMSDSSKSFAVMYTLYSETATFCNTVLYSIETDIGQCAAKSVGRKTTEWYKRKTRHGDQ